MYFHVPVCVTSVEVELTATGGIPRARPDAAGGLDTRHLPRFGVTHRLRRLHRRSDVLLDVHRHFLADCLAQRLEADEPGASGERAEDRGVHDRLGSGAEPVAYRDPARVHRRHAEAVEQRRERISRLVAVDEDLTARLEPARDVYRADER